MKHILLHCLLLGVLAVLFSGTGETTDTLMPDIGLPGLSDSDEIPDWVVRWELARCLAILERYDEAILDYRLLLKEKPELQKARIEMAQALLWSNRRDEAGQALEHIETEHLDLEDGVILADIYRILHEYELARLLYRAALEATPGDHETRLKLAEMLSWEENYEESLGEYRIILEALPDDIQIRRKYAMVLIWSGNHAKAVPELRKTLK